MGPIDAKNCKLFMDGVEITPVLLGAEDFQVTGDEGRQDVIGTITGKIESDEASRMALHYMFYKRVKVPNYIKDMIGEGVKSEGQGEEKRN